VRLQGLFLASRAGRRIFWALLVAAAVPLLLFGFAVHRAFDDQQRAQQHRQHTQAAKYVGLSLLDRLLAARTVLATLAHTGDATAIGARGDRRSTVLTDVASVAADGRLIAGDPTLWGRWRDAAGGGPLDDGVAPGEVRLAVGAKSADDAQTAVMLALRDAREPRRWWLAQVDHEFLFAEIGASGICVRDAAGRVIACPARADEDTADDAAPGASWRLFLKSDFGVDDWVLAHSATPSETTLGPEAVARTALLGAVAAVLVVMLLSLIQVRRTMVPLERLTAGTQRLAAGEFTARVDDRQADEFGELARAFNHMAQRLGSQVEAMHVQSAIDREILGGLDVASILRRVAQRLTELSPVGAACVVEVDRATPALARVHRGDGTVRVVAIGVGALSDPVVETGDGLVVIDDPATWLRQSLAVPVERAGVHVIRMKERAPAVLALALGQSAIDDVHTLREIGELGNRVAVALSSADRERRLLERAMHDSLTGLVNRFGWFEHLEALVAQPDAASPFSVLFLDLDRFKEVNDAHGHPTGDALLTELGRRLRGLAPSGSIVARPGGDEFALAVSGERGQAERCAELVQQALMAPVSIDDRQLSVGCSIGMSHFPADGCTAGDLMRRADQAVYAAKSAGGGRSIWFEPAMDLRLEQRAELLADLKVALDRQEFELHYQPRVGAREGVARSAEALLRWRPAGAAPVPPSVFIELLEQSGLIDSVGLWAIESACRQLFRWRSEGLPMDSVAVNVSTRQLQSASFVPRVLAILRRCGMQSGQLELEITESIFIENPTETIARLCELRDAGVRLSLDDFGTGYSSLSYLHTLPISCLKIDRSFVAELGQRESALVLARTIVALAGALRLKVVAEGVETEAQASMLRDLGCHELQGYLFAKPLPVEAFASYCRETKAGAAA
jgi:diguanylate cyclase (GGDEF)-like protein